jgi:hypothetical protein
MLVYLDTAQLSLLERATPEERYAFLRKWTEAKCELALTLHHFQEGGQGADESGLRRRLSTIAEFPLVRSLPASETDAMLLEIQLQVYELLGYAPDPRNSGLTTLFPIAVVSQLHAAIALRPIYTQMREAYELRAQASNSSKAARLGAPRMNLRTPIEPSALNSDEARRLMEGAMADTPREVQQLMRSMLAQVREQMLEHGTVRGALEAQYGLSGVHAANRIRDDDLAASAVFYSEAKEQIAVVLNRTGRPEDVENVYRRLDPYAAPGVSLRLAVQRARALQAEPEEPGDDVDSAHLAFAPYVDLLFADKRTVHYVTQEARDRPECIDRPAASKVRRAGSLDSVLEHIGQLRSS